MNSISILGVGRLGGSFAIGLSRAGLRVADLIVREGRDVSGVAKLVSPEPRVIGLQELRDLDSDVVIVSVQDTAIASAAESLSGKIKGPCVVLHTSGSLSSDVLGTLRSEGHSVGSLHPLISFSDPVLGADRLSGGYFCIEGDEAAAAAAAEMVGEVGGIAFTIDPGKKALYHAAAVTACGHVVALLDVAFELLAGCGLSREEAKEILMPLVKGTVLNLESQSPEEALTGPFARLDSESLERNLTAIEEGASDAARKLYLELGARSLELAERHGADADRVLELRRRIELAK